MWNKRFGTVCTYSGHLHQHFLTPGVRCNPRALHSLITNTLSPSPTSPTKILPQPKKKMNFNLRFHIIWTWAVRWGSGKFRSIWRLPRGFDSCFLPKIEPFRKNWYERKNTSSIFIFSLRHVMFYTWHNLNHPNNIEISQPWLQLKILLLGPRIHFRTCVDSRNGSWTDGVNVGLYCPVCVNNPCVSLNILS